VLAWKHATVESINETMFIIGKKFINRSCMGLKKPVKSCAAASASRTTAVQAKILASRQNNGPRLLLTIQKTGQKRRPPAYGGTKMTSLGYIDLFFE